MRVYSKISPNFWVGDTGRELRRHRDAQVLAHYLISAPAANMIGLYRLSVPTAAHETGMSHDEVRQAFAVLTDLGFVSFDDARELVFVHELASYQIAEELKPTDKRVKNIERLLKDHASHPFYTAFLDRYGKAFNLTRSPSDAPSKGHQRGFEGASNHVAMPLRRGEELDAMPLRSQEQEQEQQQDQDKNLASQDSCSEPAEPASEPEPLLTFNCSGKPAEWHLYLAKLEEWEAAFPGVDVLAEAKKARQWMIDNPTKRKTAKGMTKFLNGWLARVQDRGGPAQPRTGPPVAPAAPKPLRALTPFEVKHLIYDPHSGAKRDAQGNLVLRDCGDPACDHCAARRKGAAA